MPEQSVSQVEDGKASQRRVRRPKDKDELMKRLQEEEVFDTYRDTMCFAAALGYAEGRRIPFDQTAEPIAWHVFTSAGHDAFVNMLAAVSASDFRVLSTDRIGERITIFEEYANGGLTAIAGLLDKSPRTPLDALCDLILTRAQATERTGVDLKELASGLFLD